MTRRRCRELALQVFAAEQAVFCASTLFIAGQGLEERDYARLFKEAEGRLGRIVNSITDEEIDLVARSPEHEAKLILATFYRVEIAPLFEFVTGEDPGPEEIRRRQQARYS